MWAKVAGSSWAPEGFKTHLTSVHTWQTGVLEQKNERRTIMGSHTWSAFTRLCQCAQSTVITREQPSHGQPKQLFRVMLWGPKCLPLSPSSRCSAAGWGWVQLESCPSGESRWRLGCDSTLPPWTCILRNLCRWLMHLQQSRVSKATPPEVVGQHCRWPPSQVIMRSSSAIPSLCQTADPTLSRTIPFTLIRDLQLGFNKMHLKLEVSRTELNVALKADSGLGWSLVQPCRPHFTISRVPKHVLPAVTGRGTDQEGGWGNLMIFQAQASCFSGQIPLIG